MNYAKIKKDDVLNIMIGISVCVMNPTNVISIPTIAHFLNTSKYQVRKYINELRNEGLVEIGIYPRINDEEILLPIKGFCITKKAESLDEYKKRLREENEIINKTFFVKTDEVKRGERC